MELHQQAKQTAQGLSITSEMYRQARGNKMHMIVKMRPIDFLTLTTTNNTNLNNIHQDCKKLEEYNRWAEEGESILMPFLYVDGGTGAITGHEGRHRAGALICAKVKEMPVSIRIRPTDEHDKKYGHFKSTYDMKFEDLPEYIHGEYGRGVLDKKDLRLIVDGWDNLNK